MIKFVYDIGYWLCHLHALSDQIGRFFKVPCENFSYKSSPNIWQCLGYFEKHHLLVKTAVVTFWATFWCKSGYILF